MSSTSSQESDLNKIIVGDCRTIMRDLIAEGMKVQMCVTSPPYWGLRDYGVEGQLGLESTPEEYVSSMVEMFRLVRDLLADDGTLWLNLGDSYVSAKSRHSSIAQTLSGKPRNEPINGNRPDLKGHSYLKDKDLCGIPWRVAFALQADGWWLRQDIIWHKPNPMPESVTDRCTKSHEYLFLMAKAAKYYYDAKSIAEKSEWFERDARSVNGRTPHKSGKSLMEDSQYAIEGVAYSPDGMRNRRSVWTVNTTPYLGAHFATFPPALIEPCILAGSRPGDTVFDPFMGSGTTAQVAEKLGRKWLGCELNPEYEKLQLARTAQTAMQL